ncbi:HigA family addiction module antitoxin [Acidithiobacillus caldus]|jgi:addiction module HigA family antidote|nr:HigA family addiction module antitoxin [Acidithiobacillus caldus]
MMIPSFRDKVTATAFEGRRTGRLPPEIQPWAPDKLRMLDAAIDLEDLKAPPGNRPEPLRGSRAGQWSIRSNDQWRICFRWEKGHAFDVEIVDYHFIMNKPDHDGLLPLSTPGDILRLEFMEPLGLSANALARTLHVPPNRISAILHGRRAITADTALRLARYFGTSAEFWLKLQTDYDLRVARREKEEVIRHEVKPRAA